MPDSFAPRVTTHPRRLAIVALVIVAMACGADRPSSDTAAAGRQPVPAGIDPRMVEWRSDGVLIASEDSLRKIPGYVVDSVFPPAEALARFRSSIAEAPATRFTGGAASPDALVRRYWEALVAGDTAAIASLVLTRNEFAWLYFEGSAESRSGLQPHVAWRMMESASAVGLQRSKGLAGGRPGPLVTTFCRGTPRDEGKVRSIGPCGVVLPGDGRVDSLVIARRVVVRDGVAKLFSFADDR